MSATLAILAGGKGVRMGMPKSNLFFEGQPILSYLLARFAWPGPTILVTGIGNEHPAGAEDFDAEVTDAVADQGPLRGILTALENTTTDLLAIATVDMPAVTTEMLEHLIESLTQNPEATGIMFESQIENTQQIEPFPCVLRRTFAPSIRKRIELGHRSVYGLTKEGVKLVSPRQEWTQEVWRNLNTPTD
jgi:molybdopterin-guanine dinucleotide biosynthesis protein A